jgi:sugar/nucleoside kinase (ribokinase family)
VDRLASLVPVLAVKLGPEGALARCGAERFSCPALNVEAIDPVGAGDSFDAGFIHQYVRGADLATCLAYGNLAGAFSTTRPGGTEAFRERANLEDFLARHGKQAAHGPAPPAQSSLKANS